MKRPISTGFPSNFKYSLVLPAARLLSACGQYLGKVLLPAAVVSMMLTCCAKQVSLQGRESNMVKPGITQTEGAVAFPDDNPSIPDGQIVWNNMKCAECHGIDGAGLPGKVKHNLRNVEAMEAEIPIEQYQKLAYGMPGIEHPSLRYKLSNRQIWDLLFYVRSLAVPLLSDQAAEEIDPVFGANCAVCHGKRGYGDGPLAHNLDPLPANFHQFNRFFDRPDSMLNNHITEGIYPSAMPAFLGQVDRTKKIKFDERYIKQLVSYVRRFAVSDKPTGTQNVN